MADGSIIFDTRIDNSKLLKDAQKLQSQVSGQMKDIEVKVSADTAEFARAVENAKDKLVDLSMQARVLKQGERDIEKALQSAAKQYGETSKQAERYKNDLIDNKRAQLDVRNEIKQVNAELRQQQAAFSKAQSPVKSYGNTLSDTAYKSESLSATLKSGVTMLKGLVVGYAGKTLYEALIGGNAEFEQYMTSFDVLLGSARQAEAMMEDLEQFAAKTPLTLPDTTKAAQMLLSYGVAQEDVIKRMEQLGDVSQGNAEKLDRVSLAYGQMLAKGKVTGEELRQMTEAGVPLTQALADAMEVSTSQLSKMIETGKVGIPELNAALELLTGEGGKFAGMMEKQSQTLNGLLSTLSDNISMFARDVGDETFAYLKEELQGLIDTIRQMDEDGSLHALAGEIGQGIANAVKFVTQFVKILWDMRQALVSVAAGVVAFKVSIAAINIVKPVTEWVKAFVLAIRTLRTGETVITAVKNANDLLNISLSASVWGAVAVAIGAAVGALVMFNNTSSESVQAAAELADEFDSAMKTIEDARDVILDETSSRDDLISAIQSVNDSYDTEAAALKDVNQLREEGVQLLDEESRAQADKLLREGYTGYLEANNVLGSKVEGGLSWDYGRNAAVDKLAAWGYFGDVSMFDSYFDMSKEEALKIVSDEIDKLNNLVKNGTGLTAQQSEALRYLSDEYNRLYPVVSEARMVVDNYHNAMNIASQSTADAADSAQNAAKGFASLGDAISALSGASGGIETLSKAMGEFEESGALSADTLAKLNEQFGALDGFAEFVNLASDSSTSAEELQSAINALGAEYIDSTGILENVTAETAKVTEAQLESMGVTNAHELVVDTLSQRFAQTEIAQKMLTSATEEETSALIEQAKQAGYTQESIDVLRSVMEVARAKNIDLTNATWDTIQQLINEGSVSEDTGKMIQWYAYQCQLASMTAIDTSSSIANLADLAVQLDNTSTAVADFVGLQAVAGASSAEIMQGYGGPEAWQAAVNAAKNKLQNSLRAVTPSGGNRRGVSVSVPSSSAPSSSGGGSRSSSGSGSSGNDTSAQDAENERKAKVEAYKEAVSEQMRLDERWNDRQLKFGKITQQEYLRNIGNRADAYRAYADEVMSLEYMTEEEKASLRKEYLEKAEDYDLEYFEYYRDLANQEAEAMIDAAKEYIDERNRLSDWGADSEIAAWERVKAKVQQYYDEGKIAHEDYLSFMEQANEGYFDALDRQIDARHQDSLSYADEKSYFNEWGSDDPFAARERFAAGLEKDIAENGLSREEADKLKKEFDDTLFQNRLQNSYDWIEEQKYYSQLSYDEGVAAYQRIADYVQDYYNKGLIDRRTYLETMNDLNRKFYALEKEEAERQIREEYEALNEALDEREKALQDAYDRERELEDEKDRAENLEELRRRLAMYEGAVTVEGQDEYRSIKEQIEALEDEQRQQERENKLNEELLAIEEERTSLAEQEAAAIEKMTENLSKTGTYMASIAADVASIMAWAAQYVNPSALAAPQLTGGFGAPVVNDSRVYNYNVSDATGAGLANMLTSAAERRWF